MTKREIELASPAEDQNVAPTKSSLAKSTTPSPAKSRKPPRSLWGTRERLLNYIANKPVTETLKLQALNG